jgi:hypothetical protein
MELLAKVYNGKKAQRFSGENIEESVARFLDCK